MGNIFFNLTSIFFQMGWFNHQLVIFLFLGGPTLKLWPRGKTGSIEDCECRPPSPGILNYPQAALFVRAHTARGANTLAAKRWTMHHEWLMYCIWYWQQWISISVSFESLHENTEVEFKLRSTLYVAVEVVICLGAHLTFFSVLKERTFGRAPKI